MVNMVLDTCVLSELKKPVPSPAVVQAVMSMNPSQTYVSVITIGELIKGIALMPHGQRRRDYETWHADTEEAFQDRILPIETDVARLWGRFTADLQSRGRQLAANDGLIAATAIIHGMSVMTRNTKHFADTGVVLIDPWQGID